MSGFRFFITYGILCAVAAGVFFFLLKSTDNVPRDVLPDESLSAVWEGLAGFAEKLPPPLPGEWRYEMQEPGQTLEEFVKARWNRPDSLRRTIYLRPLGPQDRPHAPDLAILREFASRYFMLPVEILPALDIDSAKLISRINSHTGERQFLTTDILYHLENRLPADAFCCAGVTIADLYPEPSWDYVFGQASLIRRVGVFSFARYDPEFHEPSGEADSLRSAGVVLRRSCKVLGHEIGHMFGLYHCITFRCGMNGSNNLPESDAKPIHLCPVCLGKLQYSIGFGVLERYEGLRGFYAEHGFWDLADEVGQRIRAVRAVQRGKDTAVDGGQ